MSNVLDSQPRRPETATSINPLRIWEVIVAARITHVITVPDTHQKSLLEVIAQESTPHLITVCTEDEAMGVNLGLFIGGARPMVLIQNSGFYAAMNTIRGLSQDARVPACLLIGEFSRDPSKAPADHASRLVHLLEPTLETWKIPYYRLDHESDVSRLATAFDRAWNERGPVAALVGAPTAELS